MNKTAAAVARDRVIAKQQEKPPRVNRDEALPARSQLQQLIDEGFRLITPMARNGCFLSITRSGVRLSHGARVALRQPAAAHLLAKDDVLVMVAAHPSEHGAYRLPDKSSIGGDGLLAQLRAAGWTEGRYRAKVETDLLTFHQGDKL